MGATRTRISLLTVTVACAVALLAGCTGGDGSPVPTPTADAGSPTAIASPSASPSVTASPTPGEAAVSLLETTFPEALAREDVASAVAFADRFLSEYHEWARESPEVFEAISAPDCEFCSRVASNYESAVTEDVTYDGGTIDATPVLDRAGLQTDGTWAVEFEIVAEDLMRLDADGQSTVEVEGGPGEATVMMAYDDRWFVTYVWSERAQ